MIDNLPILPVISSFGLYLIYSVSGRNGTSSVASEFIEINVNTSHPLSSVLHPIQQEQTQKDKLYNDLIHYLASFSVSLKTTTHFYLIVHSDCHLLDYTD